MFESIITAFNAVKQTTPTLLFGVAFVASALLFLPANVVGTLGLDGLVSEHRHYIGIALVSAIALLLAQGLVGIVGLAKLLYAKHKSKQAAAEAEQRRLEILTKLTPEEKAYLLPYIVAEKNTLYFSIADGIAGGLQAKGIIYQASNIGNMLSGFAFNIQPWAREHLSQTPQLLEGARLPERRSQW